MAASRSTTCITRTPTSKSVPSRTTFPYSRKQGRAGSGQLSATSYTVPQGAVSFWKEHLERHKVEHSGVQERFGAKFLRFRHPAGLLFEVVEDATDKRNPWTTKEVSKDVATRGFLGAVLSVRDVRDQESFFVEALGFRKTGVDGPYHRFEIAGGGPSRTLDLHHEPDRLPGSWGFGAGTAHHIAMNLEDDETMVKQKARYEELGFTDCSEIKDRVLLPLDVYALARRHSHRVHVERPGRFLPGRDAGRTRDEAAPSAVVRGSARLHRRRSSSRSRCRRRTSRSRARRRSRRRRRPALAKSAVPLSTYKAASATRSRRPRLRASRTTMRAVALRRWPRSTVSAAVPSAILAVAVTHSASDLATF